MCGRTRPIFAWDWTGSVESGGRICLDIDQVVFCFVLFCFILFYFVLLFCFILFCFILFGYFFIFLLLSLISPPLPRALHLRAKVTFVDVYGKERKAGKEWLVTKKTASVHILDVYEEKVADVAVYFLLFFTLVLLFVS